MEKEAKKFSMKTMLILAGTYVSFGIGAGFATGTELLQFWSCFGLKGIIGMVISSVLILGCIGVISNDCRKYELHNMDEMFKHYCGKYIGMAIRWLETLALFLMVGSMISGGATSMSQTLGIDMRICTLIMLVAVTLTVLLGMRRLTDILGGIAPFILIAVVIICFFNYANPSDTLAEGNRILIESSGGLTMSNNLIFAAILNFTYVVLDMGAYSANVADRADERRELVWGNLLGQTAVLLCQVFIFIAFILNASVVAGQDIPIILLGAKLGSAFSVFYGIIVILATYTTATGMAWLVSSNIKPEKDKKYKLISVLICLGAYVFTFFGTFGVLMNVVMSLISYVGIAFAVCVIVSKTYRWFKEKNAGAENN